MPIFIYFLLITPNSKHLHTLYKFSLMKLKLMNGSLCRFLGTGTFQEWITINYCQGAIEI